MSARLTVPSYLDGPARGISGMDQRFISSRFQINSHCHRLPGARMISEVTHELLECAFVHFEGFSEADKLQGFILTLLLYWQNVFFRLDGLLKADKLQGFILMSLLDLLFQNLYFIVSIS